MIMINYRTIVLNLRGAGGLTAQEVSDKTGIRLHKIHRMASGGSYIPRDTDMIELLNLHYDYCPHMHKKSLLMVQPG